MIATCDAAGGEGREGTEKVSAHLPLLPCYLDRMRRGLPPAQEEDVQGVERGPPTPDQQQTEQAEVAATALDPIPLSAIAPHLPDPQRPFWWFSNTPLPHKKQSAGCPVEEPCGTRLPPEADYWCHEGDTAWVKVDRSITPKPEPKRRKKKARKARVWH